MKTILMTLGILVLLVVGYFAAVMIGSELAGEVVVLRTQDENGEMVETRLWVVDHENGPWLRAGNPDSAWLLRMRAQPRVEVERNGTTVSLVAVPYDGKPARRNYINQLFAEKYGFVDLMISPMRDEKKTVPVRLDRR